MKELEARNQDFLLRKFNRMDKYQRGVELGRYKSVEELDFENCGEAAHIHILTDTYLETLLRKAQKGIPLSLEEVGDLFGITRERVRQAEFMALKRIKRRAPVLKDHLDCNGLDF